MAPAYATELLVGKVLHHVGDEAVDFDYPRVRLPGINIAAAHDDEVEACWVWELALPLGGVEESEIGAGGHGPNRFYIGALDGVDEGRPIRI